MIDKAPFREEWTRLMQILSQTGAQLSYHFDRRWLYPQMEWFYNGKPKEFNLEAFTLQQLGVAFILLLGGLGSATLVTLLEYGFFQSKRAKKNH